MPTDMQTTKETKKAVSALLNAVLVAIGTYEWIIADHPKLDPDGLLPAELKTLREAMHAVQRRGFTL